MDLKHRQANKRVLKEASDLWMREVGFYVVGEPFLDKRHQMVPASNWLYRSMRKTIRFWSDMIKAYKKAL